MPPIGRAESARCSKRSSAVPPMGIMSAPVTRAAFFRHRVPVALSRLQERIILHSDGVHTQRGAYEACPDRSRDAWGHVYFHSLYARNGRKQIFAVVRMSFAKSAFGSKGTPFPS